MLLILLRTVSTCVENTISLWNIENSGCRLKTSHIVKNNNCDVRIDAMCLGSFKEEPLIGCGNNDFSLQIYHSNHNNESSLMWDMKHAHDDYINDCKLLYSNSGEYGIVSCSDDHTIRIWDVKDDKIQMEYRTKSTPLSIVTHKDKPDYFWVSEINGTIKLYDKSSSSPVCTLSAGSKAPFHQIDWNNMQEQYIGGVDNGKWYIWDWKMGKLLSSAGSLCNATGFNWSYSNSNLFTIRSSSEVLLWDTDHLGTGCLQLQQKSKIQDVTWLGDQSCCVIASGGSLIFWNINS